MKRKVFYFFLACLATIFLFSFAALCNQCGAGITEDDEKIDVEETGEEEAAAGDEEEAASEEEASGEEAEEEESAEEETGEEEEESAEEDKEAPTISLEIYEAEYSSADGVCYSRVEAKITGKPTPTVEFSKDDSGGAWGSKKCQVNLNDPGDTYTLTAAATNSEGTANASINITWTCAETAEPPVIEETDSITADNSRSGYISGSAATSVGANLIYVGDNGSNDPVKGYLSFDISDISDLDDVIIRGAGIEISGISMIGQPWDAGDKMDIKVFEYGNNLDYPADFAVGGVFITSINTSSGLSEFLFSSDSFRNELQKAVNDGKPYLQLKLGLNGVSNNSYSDVYKFTPGNSKIRVNYEFRE
jgi:hypothetical protein